MGKVVIEQFEDGVWHLAWTGGSAYVMSNSGGTNELWASTTPSFLPLENDFAATKTAQSFTTPAAFLAWVCTQYPGNPKLYVVQQSSTFTPYNGGTHQCP